MSKVEIGGIEAITGESSEKLKSGGKNAGSSDIYRDTLGDYHIKPKGGDGPGEPIRINRSELPKPKPNSD